MDPLHERVARVGLAVLDQYGFALAGGYAVQVHGIIGRTSEDVDLFTDHADPVEFAQALDAAMAAWRSDGLTVSIDAQFETFARLYVSDEDDRQMTVELGYDWRANPATRLSIGPVLHPDDAVANKVCATYSRGLPRDYVDVNAALLAGGYSKQQLLSLAVEHDRGFDPVPFAQALRASSRYSDAVYRAYGLTSEQVSEMRRKLLDWAQELDPR